MKAIRELAELRHRDPERVLAGATAALAAHPADPALTATAQWVAGLALHELGRPDDAVPRFRTAVRAATDVGDRYTAAVARASLAISLLAVGDDAAARRELATARRTAPPSARGAVLSQWGLLLQRTGRLDAARAVYDEVLPLLRAEGDLGGAARVLLNRGTLGAYQGRFAQAARDLTEAERLAVDRELWLLAAMAAHNLGFAQGRRGAVPAGLAGFDRARAAYRAVGDPPRQVAVLAADHCELLLQAGLARDARVGAEQALAALSGAGGLDVSHQTEIRMLLAQALLAEGDPAGASAQATRAAQGFRAARRAAWAALADYVAVSADVLAHQDRRAAPPAELLDRTRTIARALTRHGWPLEALHARTMFGRVALALDRPDLARRALVRAAATRRTGAVDARALGWHATALLRLASGDRAGAKHALRRGLALVERHRGTLGPTELRAGAARRGAELARAGLRLALADGRPLEVLRWAERWRAGALRLPAVTPPSDGDLADTTAALRAARRELRDAAANPGGPDEATAELERRIARLEARLRARALRIGPGAGSPDEGTAPAPAPAALTPNTTAPNTTGPNTTGPGGTRQRGTRPAAGGVDLAALRSALGDTPLVEFVAVEDRLAAVTLHAGRARLHDLGELTPVRLEIGYLLSALRRALLDPRRAPAVDATALRLQRLLVDPLGLDPAGRLVVVPTGPLHGLPWPALPALAGRPLVVAPSADLWQRRRRAHRAATGAAIALVAGPQLRGADEEIAALAAAYPGARVLRGRDATVAAVLDCFAGTELVHLAAHGQFRADSPLFSALLLADGSLTMFDLEHLPAAPSVVVLPACEAGRTAVRTGDELLGTTTALLGRGVRSVIAPVLPVPDAPTTTLMLRLHERLRAGDPPSTALGAAAAGLPPDDPVRLVASCFVCLGAAETP